MCTSSLYRNAQRFWGFTAIELLVGLTLTACLALALAPLVLSLERTATREADRTITVMHGRVGVARLERDLRLASAGGAPFAVDAPILEATPTQVIFLGHADAGPSLDLIEWEIVGGSVMRRWGACPAVRPATFAHSLYRDNKTMVEGISRRGTFRYVVGGRVLSGVLSPAQVGAIEGVVVVLSGEDSAGTWPEAVVTVARVGR